MNVSDEEQDREMALLVSNDFDLLYRVVRLVHNGCPTDEIMGFLRGVNVDRLALSHAWLLKLLKERILLGRGRTKSDSNLDHDQRVTDEQVVEVTQSPLYPTRAAQAAKLGISERVLRRRLQKINAQ